MQKGQKKGQKKILQKILLKKKKKKTLVKIKPVVANPFYLETLYRRTVLMRC